MVRIDLNRAGDFSETPRDIANEVPDFESNCGVDCVDLIGFRRRLRGMREEQSGCSHSEKGEMFFHRGYLEL
jgi:hypothetical protein